MYIYKETKGGGTEGYGTLLCFLWGGEVEVRRQDRYESSEPQARKSAVPPGAVPLSYQYYY